MFTVMLLLAAAGMGLLLTGPLIARAIAGSSRDPIAVTRMVQALGAVLLLIALMIRPQNTETRAVPGPPAVGTEP